MKYKRRSLTNYYRKSRTKAHTNRPKRLLNRYHKKYGLRRY